MCNGRFYIDVHCGLNLMGVCLLGYYHVGSEYCLLNSAVMLEQQGTEKLFLSCLR